VLANRSSEVSAGRQEQAPGRVFPMGPSVSDDRSLLVKSHGGWWLIHSPQTSQGTVALAEHRLGQVGDASSSCSSASTEVWFRQVPLPREVIVLAVRW
jgi:hypothetical protein